MRIDGRKNNEVRDLRLGVNIIENANGSVLFTMGKTSVICTAMIEEGVPEFLAGSNSGWLTAEYSMLPASTLTRKKRERLKADGRSIEIQRLIGRSLRSVCDFKDIGEYTFHIDCDVINADGGTRTASINGAVIALELCVKKAIREGIISKNPMRQLLAAVSVGICKEEVLSDLCYIEDTGADADMNLVVAENGDICELQICGEKRPITQAEFNELLSAAENAAAEIIKVLKDTIVNYNE